MTYLEAIQYLDSFINYEKTPLASYKESCKLERIKGFLAALRNPQERFQSLHVAGTKGKGSVCAFLSYILKEAGYKVGLFTSPHLSSVRERIRVMRGRTQPGGIVADVFEGMITERALADLVERLKPGIEQYNRRSRHGPLSFFEVYTALAFEYFKEQKVDYAVLETGLGGRLDATNVVRALVCGITPVSYDHTRTLGVTLTEIAGEKAGIIKGRRPLVVSAAQVKEVAAAIRGRCRQVHARLYELGKEVVCTPRPAGRDGQAFDIDGEFGGISDLKIRLLGSHQLANAAEAASMAQVLRTFSRSAISSEDIRRGLYATVWPGRFEIVNTSAATVVLDGAHNPASAHALKEALRSRFPGNTVVLVLGVSSDKDIRGICKELSPLTDTVILTRANNPRAATPQGILCEMKRMAPRHNVSLTGCVKDALAQAREKAGEKGIIVICGSLFVVGEARELL